MNLDLSDNSMTNGRPTYGRLEKDVGVAQPRQHRGPPARLNIVLDVVPAITEEANLVVPYRPQMA